LTAVGCAGASRLDRVLVFARPAWYRHEAIPQVNEYLARLGRENDFAVDATEDPSVFAPATLVRYQVVLFNNTTDIGKSLDDAQKRAFIDWFRAGGGYAGLHSASVHHDTWPWYAAMLGTNFNSDVEHQAGRVVVDPEARGHPAVRHLGASARIGEEWMNFEASVRGLPGTRVLLTLDESTIDTTVKPYFRDKGGRPMGRDHPVAWVREFEGGRVFYTNFGHDLRALETPEVRTHVLEGIRWAAGR
jgi:type 1 glutamine amidotransferase